MGNKQKSRIEPYWFIIIPLLLVTAVLFITHLLTGKTPGRVAISIPVLNFDIYWYGIWIVGGIALGAYVITRLAKSRGEAVFEAKVPAVVRERPLTDLDLPDEIQQILSKQKITTIGQLLLPLGYDPRTLGLNADGIDVVRHQLAAVEGVETAWLQDAPWRIWNPEHVWGGIGWALVLGIIGARLYHVLTPSPSMEAVGIFSPLDYFRNPYQLINLRNGGLGIYGGIAGGALGLWIFTRRQRLPSLAWADLAAVGMALGQVFGRWGNYFNQELYGRPTNLPWGIIIDPIYRLPAYSEYSRFHPAFLYESLWNLLTFFILLTLFRRYGKKLLTGDLMALYLIMYAIGRTLLETVRLDSRLLNLGGLQLNMAVATFVSLLIALAMAIWRIVAHRLAKS
ncbi:MAG: prolipoprotein diacylglyceryl transferase [Ardenticatenaceae bacterium]|nr:prolipoprotein diacylglyceryl transferase [Ardenticatenaceae bacterium]